MAQNILDPVKVATNVDTSFSAVASRTIDGITLATGDRVLVKSQTNPVQNGVYVLQSNGSLSRSTDFAASATQSTLQSAIVFVEQGSIFGETGWIIQTDGTFTVGTSAINFKRFTINENLESLVVRSDLVLRREKGIPLTNDELDNNFLYLFNSLEGRVKKVDYTPSDIIAKIKTVPADTALLSVHSVRGITFPGTPNVTAFGLVTYDATGNVSATKFTGNLEGNATSATSANSATTAVNVTGVVAIANGGTGQTTASQARTALEVIHNKGDTMEGKLNLTNPSGSGIALLNISPSQPVAPVTGDVWLNATSSSVQYRLGAVYTLAVTESPSFSGTPTAPTPLVGDNSSKIATTAFIQSLASSLQTSVNAKANSVDVYIKTETDNKFLAKIDSYNKTETDNKFLTISSAASTYDTVSSVNSKLSSYYTGSQTDSLFLKKTDAASTYLTISNAASTYDSIASVNGKLNSYATIAYVDGLQPKWGDSKKFVQSTEPTVGVSNGDFWFKTAS